MSFLTLEFAILFLKALKIDFPLILISLNVIHVERSCFLNDFSNRWCKQEMLLILVFHYTLVIHIFYPLYLNLLFVILNEVSRIFIRTMFWFAADKAANNVVVV